MQQENINNKIAQLSLTKPREDSGSITQYLRTTLHYVINSSNTLKWSTWPRWHAWYTIDV